MSDQAPDNTRQFVFPIETGIGALLDQDLVRMVLVYKLDPAEPEVYEARFALRPSLAKSIVSDLQAALRDLDSH